MDKALKTYLRGSLS